MSVLYVLTCLALAQAEPAPVDAAVPLAGEQAPAAEEVPLPTDPAELRAFVRAKLVAEGAPADSLEADVEAMAGAIEFDRTLARRSGDISVGDGLATLHLGESFAFLGPEDAGRVLVAWGNPPPEVLPLGMILPSAGNILDPNVWAVLVSYDDEGHVDDADASSIDYDALLTEMRASTAEASEARAAAGYESLDLVGWAEPPHYDADAKKLYWAKHLRSPGGEWLNYDIRVLGRRGVLSLSAIAEMDQLADVKTGMSGLLPLVSFEQGERYADFDPSVDKVAAVGIAALIGGKVVAKAGFFKLAIAGLIAGKKFVIAGAVAAAAGLRTLFGRKSDTPDAPR